MDCKSFRKSRASSIKCLREIIYNVILTITKLIEKKIGINMKTSKRRGILHYAYYIGILEPACEKIEYLKKVK